LRMVENWAPQSWHASRLGVPAGEMKWETAGTTRQNHGTTQESSDRRAIRLFIAGWGRE
jgi:hypothetical protein